MTSLRLIIPFLFLLRSLISYEPTNPFFIEFEEKETLSYEDYRELQEKLRKIDIKPLFDIGTNFSRDHFSLYGRSSVGINQSLLDPHHKQAPVRELIKINKGGECCIVSFVTFDGDYKDLQKEQIDRLKKVGFNGYYLRFVGGTPNPCKGAYLKYIGVPYLFKILALLEAGELGFTKLLWIDATFFPLKNPTPIFDEIAKNGHCFHFGIHANLLVSSLSPYLSSVAKRAFLEEGVDFDTIDSTWYVKTSPLGIDLEDPLAYPFLQEALKMAEKGLFFMSLFPEELVFTSIILKPEFARFRKISPLHSRLFKNWHTKRDQAEEKNVFFWQKKHSHIQKLPSKIRKKNS